MFPGPNLKNSRRCRSPVTVNAAIVNIMNGADLSPTQAPHFGTKEKNKVVLLLSKLASGIHSGSDWGPLLVLRYPWGIYMCDDPHWPLGVTTLYTKSSGDAVRGFSLAEFRHAHTVCTHAAKTSASEGKARKSVHAYFLLPNSHVRSSWLIFLLLQRKYNPFVYQVSIKELEAHKFCIPNNTNQKTLPSTWLVRN